MKRYLFGIIFTICFSLYLTVYSQDIKNKVPVETNPPIIELADSNTLRVRNAPIGKKLEIYSIVGTKMKEIEMKSTSGEYPLDLPKSIYIVKLGGTVQKFVVK